MEQSSSQVYAIQLSSSSHEVLGQESLNLEQEDIHICGSCKQPFNDIRMFLDHKNQCNSILASTILKQPTINLILPEPQILEVVMDEKVASLLLPQSLAADGVLQTAATSGLTRRDFQLVEQNVATLLANQITKKSDCITSDQPETSVTNATHNGVSDIILQANSNTPSIDIRNLPEAQADASRSSDERIESEVVELSDHNTIDNRVKTINNESDEVVSKPKNHGPVSFRKFYICSSCDFVTLYPNDLTRHTRKHTGERPFECSICKQKFARKDKLQTHFRIHTGEKPYKCQFCSYAAVDICPLRKHLRTHTDERPFKCQFCPYSARDSSQLTVHLRRHTGDSPFICQFGNCEKAFKTSTDLKRHKIIHTKKDVIVCSKCKFEASNERNLQAHNRLHHDCTANSICTIENCEFTTNDYKQVLIHKKSHTAEQVADQPPSKTFFRSRCKARHESHKNHSCRFCDETATKAIGSKSHIRKQQMRNVSNALSSSTFQKTFQCTHCSVSFVRQDSWRSHIKQHLVSSNQEPSANENGPSSQNFSTHDKSQIEEASSFFIDDLNSQETLDYANEIGGH